MARVVHRAFESRRLIGCAADPFDQSGSRFKGSEVDDGDDRRLPIGGLRLCGMKMSTLKIFLTLLSVLSSSTYLGHVNNLKDGLTQNTVNILNNFNY